MNQKGGAINVVTLEWTESTVTTIGINVGGRKSMNRMNVGGTSVIGRNGMVTEQQIKSQWNASTGESEHSIEQSYEMRNGGRPQILSYQVVEQQCNQAGNCRMVIENVEISDEWRMYQENKSNQLPEIGNSPLL